MTDATFIYGYDPICGWCYGAVPAIRKVARVLPVRLVMAGLVTGAKVGPTARMEPYVREASARLRQVTGRAPSEAFFAWMRRPGSIADSGPPAVAIAAVQETAPDAALAFAHAVTEAHYAEGFDPNDPGAYAPLIARHAPGTELPDLHDPVLQDAAFAPGRAMGIASFPTFALARGSQVTTLPTIYDPDALVAAVTQALGRP